MEISHTIVVLDAASPDVVSAFWAALLGGRVEADPDGDWWTVFVGDEPRLAVQLAPDHVRPGWPDGPPQQVHLDLYVTEVAAAHAEAMAAGAVLLQPAADPSAAEGFAVYADPAGHPFCLCWGRAR